MSASDLQSGSRSPRNHIEAIVAAVISGALAGFFGGVVDGLWSFGALDQYLPNLSAKLSLLLHLGLSYAFAGSMIGGLVGALGSLLWRHTSLDIILSTLRSRRDPFTAAKKSVTKLSFVLAGIPLLFLATSISFSTALQSLVNRKHPGLIIASSIGIILVTTILSLALLLLAAAVVKSGLAKSKPDTKLGETLRSRLLLIMASVLIFFGACVALKIRWKSASESLPSSTLWTAFAALLSTAMVPWMCTHLLPKPSRDSGDSPPSAAFGLALVLVGLPLLGLALTTAYFLAARNIGVPAPVLIASAMSYGLLLLSLVTLLSSVVSARLSVLLYSVLQRLGLSRPSTLRALPLVAILAFTGLAITSAFTVSGKTLSLLPLRPPWVAMLLLVFASQTRRWGHALSSKLSAGKTWIVGLAMVAFLPVLFASVVVTGSEQAVRKAQVLHTGLGEPLARAYRLLGDWDRDGYSRWLGGGDCDDSDSRVHPGADEIPFDGIDNNCLGGDVTDISESDTHFATIPDSIPDDFNVILITIDTIRADHLGAYGYPRNTTPNIDALAASGTLFKNGWAHAPSTRYSIPAMLTGRYPLKVRYFPINGQWPGISEENQTIAEVLQTQGMTTGAVLNYWYFDEKRKMNQGFDSYDNTNKRLHRAVSGKGPAETSGSSAKEQSDKAIAFVAKNQEGRFFLWVHYYDPHFDYEKHPDTKTFGTSSIDAYDHEIAFTDTQIGRLLDDLKSRGLDKKTVIVLTGDHGEGFGEHGIDLHGYHLYAAQTKVPFIVRVPGVDPAVVNMPASHVDILPTLANLSGFPSNSDMLGRSLMGVISGAEDRDQDRFVFQQLSYENNNEYRGAVNAKCHILYNVSPNLSWELYRIDEDPMEARDRIDSPQGCEDATDALASWYEHSEIPEGAMEALLAEAPQGEPSLELGFGDSLKLVDVQLPNSIRSGQSFSMTLTWKAKGSPPPGWKVFAHFENPKGGRFTGDHAPVRPFSWWQSGQYIRYTHKVRVRKNLKPGTYHLWFGIYKKSERMPATAAGIPIVDNRADIARIEVVP